MSVGCLVSVSMGARVSTSLALSAASAGLDSQDRSVRVSLHPVPPLSVSMGARAARQGKSAMSVLACLVSVWFAEIVA